MKDKLRIFYLLIFVLALVVNFSGINVNFFTDDPGLYASIAKNMLYKRDVLQLFTYGQDWLDKPHFPFWMAYLSFKVFGVSIWAYRLPALLFFLLGVLYTYLFARKFYGVEAAAIAALILMTAQYMLMGNTDVRAEPYLTGLIIGSIYHISSLEDRFSFRDLLLAALLTACAIMTKGLFVIVAIYGSLLGQLIFKRKFLSLFSFKFIALFLLTLVFILPEIYALYVQFDMHPEKTVFDRQNVSGIKWFLWDSQFGRFVNKGPISQAKGGDIFFYLHTLLWAFAPWCLLFYYAVFKRLKNLFKKQPSAEYYTLSGGLLLLLIFSLSRFQLPFYTNAIFPLFAVIMAPYCYKELSGFGTKLRQANYLLYVIAFTVAILVVNYFLHTVDRMWFAFGYLMIITLATAINIMVRSSPHKLFLINCAAVLFANLYLTTILYPVVASYNGQITAAVYVNAAIPASSKVISLKKENNVFQFYTNRPVGYVSLVQFGRQRPDSGMVFYASSLSIQYLDQKHINYRVIQTFENYPQERILPDFVNKPERYKVLDKVYLISRQ